MFGLHPLPPLPTLIPPEQIDRGVGVFEISLFNDTTAAQHSLSCSTNKSLEVEIRNILKTLNTVLGYYDD
ncbi:hypothetical protein GCM10008985_34290 [Halococcus dombrowskii]|uniref:Uncharacterized protein n=1 Tax=Halococcus dombrowskii TaxID=179637 RepID=A0AAV3SLP5_HALDO